MSYLCDDLHTTRPPGLLAGDYGKLRRYMGETAFAGVARAYNAKYPAAQPDAGCYSRHLPEFLATTAPYGRHRELAELAMLERALNEACEAGDAPIAGFADLAALAPEDFGGAVLDMHPSARRLRATTNVTSLWSCLKCHEAPPRPHRLDAPRDILVWRQNGSARFRLLGGEEASAFDAAAKGVRLAVICEMLAAIDDPATAAERAAAYLRGWVEAQAVSRIRIADAAALK